MNISMRHLRYLEALVRHGHFGRAAEACSITQPALSIQIRELEEIVGTPLVERSARGVRPTGLGEVFAGRARDILRAVDELGELARASRATFSGPLRLGVIPTIAPYLLPRLVVALAERLPGIDLRPREAVTGTLLADLLDGRLDVALLALPVSEPALVECPLFDEEFLLVRSARDEAPAPMIEDLRRMRLLLLEEGHCFRDQALAYCRLPSLRSGDVIEGNSLTTLVQLVGAGLGVTLVPEMAVAVETGSAPVAATRLPEPRPTRTVGMVWRRSNPLASRFESMAEMLRKWLPETEGADASPFRSSPASPPSSET